MRKKNVMVDGRKIIEDLMQITNKDDLRRLIKQYDEHLTYAGQEYYCDNANVANVVTDEGSCVICGGIPVEQVSSNSMECCTWAAPDVY